MLFSATDSMESHLDNIYRAIRRQRSEDEIKRWNEIEDHSAEFHGKKICIRSIGEGPVIVCFHGIAGSGSQFLPLAEKLAQGSYKVVMVDLPGHGDSEGERLEPKFVDALKTYLAEKFDPIECVIGHSMGNKWILFALQMGLQSGKYVGISPFGHVDFGFKAYQVMTGISDESLDEIRTAVAEYEGEVYMKAQDPQIAASEKAESVKALIIAEKADAIIPFKQSRMLADAWEGSQFAEISGTDHFSIIQKGEVIEIVADFLRD